MSERFLSRRAALMSALALSVGPAFGQAGEGSENGDGKPAKPKQGETRKGDRKPAAGKGAKLALPKPPELAGAKWRLERVNGTQIAVAEFGLSSGEPVLFLHGGMGSSRYWGHQITDLATTHRVIAMDTRGHGRSPVPPDGVYGFATFARDVEALVGHLGLPPVAIVGWSDGGITGLQLALTKSKAISRLFTFGANTNSSGLIAGGSKKPAFAAYAAQCKADYASISPTKERWGELMSGLGAMWRREPNFTSAGLGTITIPTTVAFAQYDEIIPIAHAKYIAKTIPDARLAELDGVSHFAMLQNPGMVTDAIRAFLRSS